MYADNVVSSCLEIIHVCDVIKAIAQRLKYYVLPFGPVFAPAQLRCAINIKTKNKNRIYLEKKNVFKKTKRMI